MRLCALRAFVPYMSYAPSGLICLRPLRAFAPYMLYSHALCTRLARLFEVLCTPYLYTLKPFQDRLAVQQKLPIFQGLLKALQTVLFLGGSKNSRETS